MSLVLLIEDDLDIRENTVELLELQGYNIISAVNGVDGFSKAKEHLPDVIVCDMRMPEMNGLEVLDKLKEDPDTQSIPFIFCSASAQPGDIERGKKAGAAVYITKPYSEETLYDAIEKFLAKK